MKERLPVNPKTYAPFKPKDVWALVGLMPAFDLAEEIHAGTRRADDFTLKGLDLTKAFYGVPEEVAYFLSLYDPKVEAANRQRWETYQHLVERVTHDGAY